jgi:hypothetical protein
MGDVHRNRVHLRWTAALAAVIGVVLASAPVSAAGFGPTKVLRSAATGVSLAVGSVEAWRDNIVVGWREDPPPAYKNFLRWSTNGGKTFGPVMDLGNGDFNYGGAADVCGGFVIALTGATSNHQLVMFSLDDNSQSGRDLYGPSEGTARSASLTCAGDRRLVVAWNDESISPPHTKVVIQPLFESIPSYFFDLGPSDSGFAPAVAATGEGIHLAWINSGQLRYKRFSIANNQNASVTAHATVNLVSLPGGGELALGAYRDQVALAYRQNRDTMLKLSTNGGLSFGSPSTVVDKPDSGNDYSGPNGADIRGDRILIAIVENNVSLPLPDAIRGSGRLSNDGGTSWQATPSHIGGYLSNVLYKAGGAERVAEAWDQRYFDPPGSIPHEKLRFHTGNP